MPGTTAHGLPYPLGTDLLADGDDAIKALAEAVDTGLYSFAYWRGTLAGGTAVAANVTCVWTQVENRGPGLYSAGNYTVKLAGIYRVLTVHKVNSATVVAPPIASFRKNGAGLMAGPNIPNAAYPGMSLEWVGRLAVNDVISSTVNLAYTVMTEPPAENTILVIQYLGA